LEEGGFVGGNGGVRSRRIKNKSWAHSGKERGNFIGGGSPDSKPQNPGGLSRSATGKVEEEEATYLPGPGEKET